jgi:hypothetical protein
MCILFLYQIKSYVITTCEIISRREARAAIYRITNIAVSDSPGSPIVVQCAIAYIYLVPEFTSPAVFSRDQNMIKYRINFQLFLLYVA